MQERAYRYRFYPDEQQRELLLKTFGCVRFVYNWGLEIRTKVYKETGEGLSGYDTMRLLTSLRRESSHKWLQEVSMTALQQSLLQLDRAFKNFWDKNTKSRYPALKRKRTSKKSARFTRNAFRWHPGRKELRIAKSVEPLDIRWSRHFKGDPTSVTVSLDPAGRWHISILVKEEIKPLRKCRAAVGVDVGITSFATLSTGEKIDNPHLLLRAEQQLARVQRRLSKKKKGSNNRGKARFRVAKIHAKVADRRQDFQHKLTTRLVRENQTICVETLSVSNMLKNHCLAKHIADASWGSFFRQLEYKALWYGREVVAIDRWFPSSKTCHKCGVVRDKLPLDVRVWTCGCGEEHDRDVNAAKNILAAGLAVTACGGHVSRFEVLPSVRSARRSRKVFPVTERILVL